MHHACGRAQQGDGAVALHNDCYDNADRGGTTTHRSMCRLRRHLGAGIDVCFAVGSGAAAEAADEGIHNALRHPANFA